MLYGILLGLDVLVAIALIVLILLHRGRGAEVGAVFGGGGSSSSVFGASGPQSFLSKFIAILATFFLLNSLALAYLANRDFTTRSVLDDAEILNATTPTSVINSDIPNEEGMQHGADTTTEQENSTGRDRVDSPAEPDIPR